jgi:DNA helicase HerA-like ATPase
MPLVTTLWNRLVNRAPPDASGIALGYRVRDGQVSRSRYLLPHSRRLEHLVVLGKTGTGKTSLIKSMLARDVRGGHGFLCIDLHGDLGPFILGRIRQRERPAILSRPKHSPHSRQSCATHLRSRFHIPSPMAA